MLLNLAIEVGYRSIVFDLHAERHKAVSRRFGLYAFKICQVQRIFACRCAVSVVFQVYVVDGEPKLCA